MRVRAGNSAGNTPKPPSGFTLIELMVVVGMVAIIAAIALPSYQQYARRNALAAAQQEMLRLAELLERHKSRNFSYKGFNPVDHYGSGNVTTGTDDAQIRIPVGAASGQEQYTLSLVDATSSTTTVLSGSSAQGMVWAIRAVPNSSGVQSTNAKLLLTSTGIRCMTTNTISTYTSCGTTGVYPW